jgi:hypothetical protein
MAEECYVVGPELYVRGKIDAKVVWELVNNPDITTVELHSPGGAIPMAQQAAKFIHARNITTRVPANGICASSCTLVYQSGQTRISAASGFFVYHCVGFLDEWEKNQFVASCGANPAQFSPDCQSKLNSLVQDSIETTRTYFAQNQQDYGASPALFTKLMAQPMDEDWFTDANFCQKVLWLKAADAQGLNVVQKIE